MGEHRMCECKNTISVNAKCNDLCSISVAGPGVYYEESGYVNPKFQIGSGDTLEFIFCSDCGKIKGNFPILSTDPLVCTDCGQLGVKQEFGKGVYCEVCRVIFYPNHL